MKARRSESVKGLSLTSSRQENVPEPVFSTFSTVWAIRLNGRSVLSSLTCPRLTPASPVSSAPVNPRDAGIAGHDFDQRGGGLELAGHLADLRDGKEQQPVFFKEFAGPERLNRIEMPGIAGQFLRERGARGAGEFRRRRVHHGEDGPVAIECLSELIVALAPIQIGRNQRVDVGVDREVPGRIEARRDRKYKRHHDGERGKARASLNNRDNNTCQHIFSF